MAAQPMWYWANSRLGGKSQRRWTTGPANTGNKNRQKGFMRTNNSEKVALVAGASRGAMNGGGPPRGETLTEEFGQRVRANQAKLRSDLSSHYDFIVCGSGSSGSVVAGKLAENQDVSVLLIEAGGDDGIPNVTDARQWVTNIGSERYWQ